MLGLAFGFARVLLFFFLGALLLVLSVQVVVEGVVEVVVEGVVEVVLEGVVEVVLEGVVEVWSICDLSNSTAASISAFISATKLACLKYIRQYMK